MLLFHLESFSNTLTFSLEFSFVLLNKRNHFNPCGMKNHLEDELCPKLLQIIECTFCTVTPNRSTWGDKPSRTEEAASIISSIIHTLKKKKNLIWKWWLTSRKQVQIATTFFSPVSPFPSSSIFSLAVAHSWRCYRMRLNATLCSSN